MLPPLGVYDPLGLIETRDMRRYEIMEIKSFFSRTAGFTYLCTAPDSKVSKMLTTFPHCVLLILAEVCTVHLESTTPRDRFPA